MPIVNRAAANVTEGSNKELLLCPYRVLDLTDEKGELCGAILANLGADVIQIEKPSGAHSRSIGPFWHDVCEPEKSLHWFAYNRGKRGITLNFETAEGKELFKKLVPKADFIVESFPPTDMARLGLDYAELSKINPRVILTSITPFGQTGPFKNYKASDITLMAMGGVMSLTGDSDRAPLRFCHDQSYNLASTYAAVATMIAHYYRQTTGYGQQVDVSIYECIVRLNHREPLNWEFEKHVSVRTGNRYVRGRLSVRVIWRCRDGYISWLLFGGETGAKENSALVRWMDEEDMAGILKQVDWRTLDLAKLSESDIKSWEELIGKFFLKHTKKEIEVEVSRRGIRIVPVYDVKDVAENIQLAARNYWIELSHPELNTTIKYPGTFFLSNRTKTEVRCRAPLIGEHNTEIYGGECGLTAVEIVSLKQQGVI